MSNSLSGCGVVFKGVLNSGTGEIGITVTRAEITGSVVTDVKPFC